MMGVPTVDHGDATEHAVPCFRCGMCCIKWQPLLGPAEIRRLAGELGITPRTFKRRYTRPFPLRRGWHQLREGAVGCVFLDVQDGIYGCTIHTIRPDVCRAWQAGLVACFLSGVIGALGAVVGDYVRRYTPRAALLAALSGIALTFTQSLDKSYAEDAQNFSGERWNYQRTSNYGSPEFSVENPDKKGHDKLDITAAKLSADGKTVTLAIADLKPVNQQLLKFRLKTADGTEFKQDVLHTINVIP